MGAGDPRQRGDGGLGSKPNLGAGWMAGAVCSWGELNAKGVKRTKPLTMPATHRPGRTAAPNWVWTLAMLRSQAFTPHGLVS